MATLTATQPVEPRSKKALRGAELALEKALAHRNAQQAEIRERLGEQAHDIKGAVGPIVGYSQLMKGGDLDPERIEKNLTVIHQSALRAIEICDGIVSNSFGRAPGEVPPDEVQDVDVGKIATEISAQFGLMAGERDVNLDFDVESGFPVINTVPTHIYRCLTNLVTNAVKFTPSGGNVTVKAMVDDAEDAVVLIVRDSGEGIPLEQVVEILKRGTTTVSPSGDKGTGLGLNIVNGLMADIGGTFDIDSVPGQGTTVSLKFPKSMHAALATDAKS